MVMFWKNVMLVHFVTQAPNMMVIYFQKQTNKMCSLADRKPEMLSLDKSQPDSCLAKITVKYLFKILESG